MDDTPALPRPLPAVSLVDLRRADRCPRRVILARWQEAARDAPPARGVGWRDAVRAHPPPQTEGRRLRFRCPVADPSLRLADVAEALWLDDAQGLEPVVICHAGEPDGWIRLRATAIGRMASATFQRPVLTVRLIWPAQRRCDRLSATHEDLDRLRALAHLAAAALDHPDLPPAPESPPCGDCRWLNFCGDQWA